MRPGRFRSGCPSMIKRLMAVMVLALGPAMAFGADEAPLQSSGIDVKDKASMQRGAALFINYCSGCHSLGFQRFSRMARDLGLEEEQVMENLVFTKAKFGETMNATMTSAQGQKWFGAAPPDLSLVTRRKLGGPDWTYSFLKSFYVDENRPSGWNNTVLAGASMPHVLWELQGIQRPILNAAGQVERVEVVKPGKLSAEEYDRVVRDLTNFLNYVGEPFAAERRAVGLWVILFLSLLAVLAFLLKKEYWKDVH